MGLPGIADEQIGHLGWSEDEVRQVGIDQAPRHGWEFRRFRFLGDHQPAHRLDRLRARRAVGAHAGEHHRHGTLLLLFGQAAEQIVHRPAVTPGGEFRAEVQAPVLHGQRVAGADHIDAIRLDRLPVDHFGHRHQGVLGEDFDQHALPIRGQVLDEDVGHAGVGRARLEEFDVGLQPAGAGADADDRERQTRLANLVRRGGQTLGPARSLGSVAVAGFVAQFGRHEFSPRIRVPSGSSEKISRQEAAAPSSARPGIHAVFRTAHASGTPKTYLQIARSIWVIALICLLPNQFAQLGPQGFEP